LNTLATPDSGSFFGRLRNAAIDDWDDYCRHEFVQKLGDGTLPQACFEHYLVQDYIFLIHFSRAWALAVYKSESLGDMRAAAEALNGLLNHEMKLHVAYGEKFGLTASDMENAQESMSNMAYTRFVLERGLSGDLLDLHVALAPCVIGYGEIGQRLREEAGDGLSSNPYVDWIEMYSGDEYLDIMNGAISLINRLADSRATESRFDSLLDTFRKATRLESAFWQSGLDLT